MMCALISRTRSQCSRLPLRLPTSDAAHMTLCATMFERRSGLHLRGIARVQTERARAADRREYTLTHTWMRVHVALRGAHLEAKSRIRSAVVRYTGSYVRA